MKILKPDTAEVLVRVFSDSDQQYALAIGLLQSFALHSTAVLPDPHASIVYAVAAQALGKDALLDEGLPKARGEFLVYGAAYPPSGHDTQPISVKVCVGSLHKQLAVFGDRTISSMGIRSTPAAFSRMPLTPAQAYGGETHRLNPKGKGVDKVVDPVTKTVQRPMPNVEVPNRLILSASDQPEPAGFWALTPASPIRAKLLGRFDDRWLLNRWPHLPTDTHPDYFQTAPLDQRLSTFFVGDERLSLHNMHPQLPFIESALPNMRARIFVEQQLNGKDSAFKELATRLETVWLFPDQLTGLVLYRAVVPLADSDGADVKHVYAELDPPASPPKSLADYCQHFTALTQPSSTPASSGPVTEDPLTKEESLEPFQAALAGLASGEILTNAATTTVSRAQVIERHALGESFANEDLSSLDLSGLALSGADFSGAQLTDVNFKEARLEQAKFDRALLTRASFTNANLTQASMLNVSASHAHFNHCNLSHAALQSGDFSHSDFTQANLDQADLSLALFSGSHMASVSALGAVAEQAAFEECVLTDANFSDARLKSATFNDAKLNRANFTRASCHRVDFSGATASEAIFLAAQLQDSEASQATTFSHAILIKANLSGVNWAGPCLDDSRLDDAILDKADMSGASLQRACLARVLARQACFAKVDLTYADLSGINLFEGILSGAKLLHTCLRSANLFGVNFMDTQLGGCDLSGSDIERTILSARKKLA
ncbi:MAG: DUF2169 domain-containing protein [Alcaligenaceae bacterium]|nr:DUF2169 domain-containing protein [Alcaligenaceae bacterium]